MLFRVGDTSPTCRWLPGSAKWKAIQPASRILFQGGEETRPATVSPRGTQRLSPVAPGGEVVTRCRVPCGPRVWGLKGRDTECLLPHQDWGAIPS